MSNTFFGLSRPFLLSLRCSRSLFWSLCFSLSELSIQFGIYFSSMHQLWIVTCSPSLAPQLVIELLKITKTFSTSNILHDFPLFRLLHTKSDTLLLPDSSFGSCVRRNRSRSSSNSLYESFRSDKGQIPSRFQTSSTSIPLKISSRIQESHFQEVHNWWESRERYEWSFERDCDERWLERSL